MISINCQIRSDIEDFSTVCKPDKVTLVPSRKQAR
uniref:Uncharacterized protein n=1 Tax=Myoviridae sp. ct3wi9 TaxID=2826610 RepID=A0A8S5MXS0_9CAUD|nr:MAG TPA: hypothetical protein [Myoviridae sp. ct3wi9]